MPKIKINKSKLKKMCERGATIDEVCAEFDVTESTARDAARNMELRYISKAQAKIRDRQPVEEKPLETPNALQSPNWSADMDCKLIESGGRYESLNALARGWGKSIQQVTARYHQVRV